MLTKSPKNRSSTPCTRFRGRTGATCSRSSTTWSRGEARPPSEAARSEALDGHGNCSQCPRPSGTRSSRHKPLLAVARLPQRS